MKLNETPYEVAEPTNRVPVKEPVMLTSLELVDRAIEIEWATTLKHIPKRNVDHALGLLVAEWSATWGPWACVRILRIAFHAMIHPVWKSRAKRRKRVRAAEPHTA